MKYFVYYDDGWADNGDVGFEICEDEDAARKFIEARLKGNNSQGEPRTLDCYRVIYGNEMILSMVERIAEIRLTKKRT